MAHAEDLANLNSRILENPQDVDLNLRYARLAEQEGALRLALAAYERILINHPDHKEAQLGFMRVRRALEPTYTSWRVELGAQWDSNPFNVDGLDEEAMSYAARAMLVDERRFGSKRWRSSANFDLEVTPDFDELNYGYVGAQTGPILDMAPHLAVIPAVGVAVATLADEYYFNEVNFALTLEGQKDGVSYWTRGRAAWRTYDEEATADEGALAEVAAGVTFPRFGAETGSLAIVPWVRWSGVDGSVFNFLNEEITPGEYFEIGVDAAYSYQLNDSVVVSAGVLAYDRTYSQTEIAGETRQDTYVAPQASLTVQNLLPCACAVRLSYRYRSNSSNDPVGDYDAHQASLFLIARF